MDAALDGLCGVVQAAVDAVEAYYIKVNKDQQILQDRVNELEGLTTRLQGELQTLEQEHALCTSAK